MAQTPNEELLALLRDRPHAQAYKQDGQWNVNVFNGQGDEIGFFGPLTDAEFDEGFRALCYTINTDDEGSLDNPDFNPALI